MRSQSIEPPQNQNGSLQLKSSAFPPNKPVALTSIFHGIIAHALEVSDGFTHRAFRQSDIFELRHLQLQWFPLKYGEFFYHRLTNSEYECLVAETSVKIKARELWNLRNRQQEQLDARREKDKMDNKFWPKRNEFFQQQSIPDFDSTNPEAIITLKIIIGAVIFELADSRGYLASSWWAEKVMGTTNTMYISTLGVIEEFRNRKVAHELLKECFAMLESDRQYKMMLLHVIEYNEAAIRLYKKFGLSVLEQKEDFYLVEGQNYKGVVMGCFFNGGELKKNWKQWIKSFF